jgi:hypothetical protein
MAKRFIVTGTPRTVLQQLQRLPLTLRLRDYLIMLEHQRPA